MSRIRRFCNSAIVILARNHSKDADSVHNLVVELMVLISRNLARIVAATAQLIAVQSELDLLLLSYYL